MVYKLPLRQTQGLMRSISKLMKLDVPVPDFPTLSRRGKGLRLPTKPAAKGTASVHLVLDSTGLKIFGAGEWLQKKHKTKAKRKRWRKLHLGLNLASGDIICAALTLDSVGDTTALPELRLSFSTRSMRQSAAFRPPLGDAYITCRAMDGAYDGTPTDGLLKARFGEAVEIIIPPPKNAALSPQSAHDPTFRDRRITEIQARGRMASQANSGYNQRSRVEAQMGRWKAVIGPKLKARRFENQQTEVKVGIAILNKMTELGRPVFEQIA